MLILYLEQGFHRARLRDSSADLRELRVNCGNEGARDVRRDGQGSGNLDGLML